MTDQNTHQDEEPEVFAVSKRESENWQFNRRDFMKAAGAAAAVTVVGVSAGGCSPQQNTLEGARAHSDEIHDLLFSLDGDLLVSAGGDETVKVWSVSDGALLHTLRDHEGSVICLALSPDGKLLATGSTDNTVKLWDFAEGGLLQTLEDHRQNVLALAFSPSGQLLASGSLDRTIKLWTRTENADNTVAFRLAQTLDVGSTVRALAVTPDGRLLISGQNDASIKVWSLPDGGLLHTLSGHEHGINSLAIYEDTTADQSSALLASAADDALIKVWSLPDGTLLTTIEPETGGDSIKFSPDGSQLIWGNWDDKVVFWNLATQTVAKQLEGHIDRVQAVAVHPEGVLLASGGEEDDCAIKLWALPECRFVLSLYDIAVSSPDFEGVQYSPGDSGDRVITQRCGASIPAGATCICNCVSGGGCSCVGHRSGGGSGGGHYWYPN